MLKKPIAFGAWDATQPDAIRTTKKWRNHPHSIGRITAHYLVSEKVALGRETPRGRWNRHLRLDNVLALPDMRVGEPVARAPGNPEGLRALAAGGAPAPGDELALVPDTRVPRDGIAAFPLDLPIGEPLDQAPGNPEGLWPSAAGGASASGDKPAPISDDIVPGDGMTMCSLDLRIGVPFAHALGRPERL